jgi:hypothetical protein
MALKSVRASVLSVSLLFSALPAPLVHAQDAAAKPKEPEFPTFESQSEGLAKVSVPDGEEPLYELWASKKNGKLLAVLPANFETQKQMIACTVTSGHPEAGVMGPTYYGTWRRHEKQVAFYVPDFTAREADARDKRSVDELYTETLLFAVPIACLKDERPVIDLGRLATAEAPRFFASGPWGGYGPSIQPLQVAFARLTKAKSFPKNAVVEYEAPQQDGKVVRVAYSLGVLEGTSGFEPRTADGRVGYFYEWHMDMGAGNYEAKPERYINRWHVEKADPALKLSPPKRPIVWYVEHTTPIKYRRYVREGIELWNEAFAKVGILGALEVHFQDATTGAHMEKDPEDVRYNFFCWNMSDAGYAIGPSRSNPETGEILDADVVWNQGLTRAVSSMLGTLSKGLLAEQGGPELGAFLAANPAWDPRPRLAAVVGEDPVRATAPEPRPETRARACRMGHGLALDFSLFGGAAEAGLLGTDSSSELDGMPEEFVGPMIRYIAAHEVGHCLGLQHNMAASNLVPLATMNEPGYDGPISASVMDYVSPNLAFGVSEHQGPYINSALGPYDRWVIAFGYGPASERAALLAEAVKPEHTYVSQMAMSFGSDPRNMTWDCGQANLAFCEARMKLVQELRTKLTSELVKDGEPWAEARKRFEQLMGTHLRSLSIAATWIGGSYENYDPKTAGGRAAVEDVPAAEQRRALAFVLRNAFCDDAFGLTPELVRHLGKEYWWDPAGVGELQQDANYSVHDLVAGVQSFGLTSLLNPARLRRVHDNQFRTTGQKDAFTLAELFTTVTDEVWKECAAKGASYSEAEPLCSSFRRNLQFEHVARLTDLVLFKDTPSPALRTITAFAAAELRRIDALAKAATEKKLDATTAAHLADLRKRIEKALDAAYVKKG